MRRAEVALGPGRAGPLAGTLRRRIGWYSLAALAGAFNTLCFAPTAHGGWIEPLVFAMFYALLLRAPGVRAAALASGAFGFGSYVTGVYWLYVSMHTYGGMPASLAAAAVVLFTLYLALYPALAGGLWRALAGTRARGRWPGALLFASTWALGEWLRGWVFTGFPWLASGYPQADGPFGGFAPLAGVYGVGWVVALAGALLACLAQSLLQRPAFGAAPAGDAGQNARAVPAHGISGPASVATAGPAPVATVGPASVATARPASVASAGPVAGRTSGSFSVLSAAGGVVLLLALGLGLPALKWTVPAGAPLHVRLLQGNVPQSMKFEQAGIDAALSLYRRMITEAPADLVITPETALPVLVNRMPEALAQAMRRFADDTGTAVLFGAVGVTPQPDGEAALTNSLFGLNPGAPAVYRYDKNHLVPFGEFVPWGFHWFVALMNIPLGDFARGAHVQAPFVVHGLALLPDICYEDIFGEEIADTLRARANQGAVLVNSTNLGWFGDTIALDQHLQMARMRALETGRPVLRATNTGATAAIDAQGHVMARLAHMTVGTLDVSVQATAGATPYVRFGNVVVVTLSLLIVASCMLAGPTRRRLAR